MMPAMTKLRSIATQLRELSPTSRLLIGLLGVIVVLSLVLVALFTGRAEMVALGLGSDIPAEAKSQAVSWLDARDIPWEERGGDILVPIDRKYAILAQLAEGRLITTDQIDFDTVLASDSPFTDQRTKRARYLVAKMNVVARMIAEMEGIERATVVIDEPERPGGIGVAMTAHTASVNIVTDGGSLGREQADAIARMVAGAHAPLDVDRVTVVDARSGRTVKARTGDELLDDRHLEMKRKHEEYAREKILEFLSNISGVRVAVNAQVDGNEVVVHRTGVEDPKFGVTSEHTSERSSSDQRSSAEPGVRSNTGEIMVGAGNTASTSESESSTEGTSIFPTQDESIKRDRGYAVKINATIRVPRSWFVHLQKLEQGGDAEPDAAALQAIVDRESAKIKEQIEPLIDTSAMNGASAGMVVVSMFTDLAGSALGTIESASGGASAGNGGESSHGGAISLVQHLIEPVGLGALAVVSLFLMLMMVRRASRPEELPTAEELAGLPPALAHDAELVGEVGETRPAMEGLEIEEGELRRQQMLEQVNRLANQSPDEAASLIRKWIRVDE